MRLIGLIACLLGVGCAAHSPSQTDRMTLAGRATSVDLYWPESTEPAPLVVVAHGFARSRHRMAGWGETLAGRGYVAAVPDLPYLTAHHDNVQGVVELVESLQRRSDGRVDPERLVLVGFSAGGLVTALAATEVQGLALWVGLDPVDSRGAAHAAAAELSIPAVTLHAEAHGCNAEGNGTTLAPAWSGPAWSAEIRGATHCDPEWPSNLSCRLFCGAPEPGPSSAFPELALDAMDAVVRCDADARRRLDHAGADPRIAWRSDDGWVDHLRTACSADSAKD